MKFLEFLNKLKRKKEKKPAEKEKDLVKEKHKEVTKEKKLTVKKIAGVAPGILIKPLVTEKSAFIGQYGQYVFEVAPKANKIEIAKAIQNTYGVKPQSINIVRVSGKEIRYGRIRGRTKNRKKAIITLKPGEKIEVHEGV